MNNQNNNYNSFWPDNSQNQSSTNEFFGNTPGGNPYGTQTPGKGNAIFTDTLFLVICILLTAAPILSFNFNVLDVLFAVGAWLLYAAVKKRQDPFTNAGMRIIGGTVKAEYILMWVGVGSLVLVGILMLALSGTIADAVREAFPNVNQLSDLLAKLQTEYDLVLDLDEETVLYLQEVLGDLLSELSFADLIQTVITLCGVMFLCMAGIMTAINLVLYRPLKKFIASFRQSAPMGQPIRHAKYIRIVLIVFAVFSMLSALGSLSSDFMIFLAEGSTGTAMLLGSILIGRYCKDAGKTQAN